MPRHCSELIDEDMREDARLDDQDTNVEDDNTCFHCNGSGEGQYDGTRCTFCKGKGVL